MLAPSSVTDSVNVLLEPLLTLSVCVNREVSLIFQL